MTPRRTDPPGADRPRHPLYSETLEGHLFAIYDNGEEGMLFLHIDGKLERKYQAGFGIFKRILDDIERDWEVRPSRELWPGV